MDKAAYPSSTRRREDTHLHHHPLCLVLEVSLSLSLSLPNQKPGYARKKSQSHKGRKETLIIFH